jgi:hypothetical protein
MPKLRRSARIAAMKFSEPKDTQPLGGPPRRSARLAAKRRGKPNTAFIKHRPTVLDKLPMDIIKHEIFALLDYDSRINLNQCLPIWDKIPSKMPKQSILKHDIDLRVKIIQRILNRLGEQAWDHASYSFMSVLKGDTRILEMIKMFKYLQQPPYFKIISLFPSFHKAVVAKIKELETIPLEDKTSYSGECLDKFTLEITKLKSKIEKEKDFFTSSPPCLAAINPLSQHFLL